MKRKMLSPEQKAIVIADAKTLGVSAAAKKHGTNPTNIYNWSARDKAHAKPKRATAKRKSPPPVTSPLSVVLDLVKDGSVDVQSAEAIIKGLGC